MTTDEIKARVREFAAKVCEACGLPAVAVCILNQTEGGGQSRAGVERVLEKFSSELAAEMTAADRTLQEMGDEIVRMAAVHKKRVAELEAESRQAGPVTETELRTLMAGGASAIPALLALCNRPRQAAEGSLESRQAVPVTDQQFADAMNEHQVTVRLEYRPGVAQRMAALFGRAQPSPADDVPVEQQPGPACGDESGLFPFTEPMKSTDLPSEMSQPGPACGEEPVLDAPDPPAAPPELPKPTAEPPVDGPSDDEMCSIMYREFTTDKEDCSDLRALFAKYRPKPPATEPAASDGPSDDEIWEIIMNPLTNRTQAMRALFAKYRPKPDRAKLLVAIADYESRCDLSASPDVIRGGQDPIANWLAGEICRLVGGGA